MLSNITAGSDFKEKNAAGTDGANLTAAQAAEQIATGTYADDTARLAAIQAFAKLSTVYGSVSKNSPLSAVPGYYLFKDKDSTAGKDDAATLFIVKVVGNQEIKRKAGQPSVEKKVQDTNDSDETTSDWQDSADYDVNDKVPFQLTATLPTDATDFAAYKTYKLVFHDSQSAGLTFSNDITVKYGNKVVSSDSYTVDTTGLNEGETFRVTINDVKTVKDTDGQPITVAAGGKFTVAYSSILNSNSVIGSTGNPNKVSLEYSNNPNVGGEGETGKTPEDTVIVFTYQLDVNKTFNGTVNDNDLPEFTLYKKNGTSDDYTKEVAKVKVVKNKVAPPFKKAEFDIMFGEGISKIGEIIDLGVDYGIIKKSGSWFSYGDRKIGQGRDSVKELLKNDEALRNEVEAKVREAMIAARKA